MSDLRQHFAEWLDANGLDEVKRRLRACATAVNGEEIEGVVLFDLPGLGTFRAVECDLTGVVRGTRYDMPHTVNITAEYSANGIEWKIVR